jgi:excisionase family DNA binding protein
MIEHETALNLLNYKSIRLLDAKEVATMIKVAIKTVHKLAREGKLACVQVTARERRFTSEQVQEYIRSQSTSLRVDKKYPRPVLSPFKKGGDRAKSSGVLSRQALLEEMRKCR